MNTQGAKKKTLTDGSQSCQHCGALVFPDSKKCTQCGKFPILLHLCPHCRCISPNEASRCWKCQYVFLPEGDYL